MPRTPLRHRLLVLVGVLATLVAGCRVDPSSPSAAPAATTTTAPGLYVAIGASDSVGIGSTNPARDAWPEVFRRMALPDGTRYANLAVPGATLASALADQLPKAVAMRPSLVTVWLNVNDLRHRVRPPDFERGLEQIVEQLRDEGGTRVLVANVPPLDRLPALRFVP
ncbi:MAG: GDSL-type esterase/lipase family protein, partial [Acidimicrobiales bacterium]